MKYHKVLAMTFIISDAIILGSFLEMTDNPLTHRKCYLSYPNGIGYDYCEFNKVAMTSNNKVIPIPILIITGIIIIAVMFVCLRYNKQRFNNMGVDK